MTLKLGSCVALKRRVIHPKRKGGKCYPAGKVGTVIRLGNVVEITITADGAKTIFVDPANLYEVVGNTPDDLPADGDVLRFDLLDRYTLVSQGEG